MKPIRLLIAGLIAPFVLAAPAFAEERFADERDCTVADRDTPTLDRAKLPDARFSMVVSDIGFTRGDNGQSITLKRRRGEETATLRGGVKLRVTLGGCEQYSNAYEFQLTGDQTPLSDNRYWLSKASGLIAEVAPANRDSFIRLPNLAAALARAARTSHGDPTAGLEGDLGATHRYFLTLSRRGRTTFLTVSYIVLM